MCGAWSHREFELVGLGELKFTREQGIRIRASMTPPRGCNRSSAASGRRHIISALEVRRELISHHNHRNLIEFAVVMVPVLMKGRRSATRRQLCESAARVGTLGGSRGAPGSV